MRVVKPKWVEHADEKGKKLPIFSVHVHPDNSRLATGGLDAKIKIWSTLPILSAEADEDEANYKLLCTMTTHNGSVLTVQWAHHGRYLASGSDDHQVLIWDLDPSGAGKVWGTDEVNVENWKAMRRLVGHESDVVDLAWSRDDSKLASVGLDSLVWIWDGYSFDRIMKIDGHQGFVKGVTWDPVGQFLATQSDDKTVKIWNTEDWSLVSSLSKPFERSPGSTFFRRLSWSPDGAFIAASNAMNGPVFVAAVIERETWNCDVNFVGHENTIEVAAFNPRLFSPPGQPITRATSSCVLALGVDDQSISIWKNTKDTPLVVFRDIFERQILDLCWSNDGHSLYGCSSDGTICAIDFDLAELPDLAAPEALDVVLNSFQYVPKHRPIVRAPSLAPAAPISSLPPVRSNALPGSTTTEQVNVLQARKTASGEKRRMKGATLNGTNSTPRQPKRAALTTLSGAGAAFAAAIDAPLQDIESPRTVAKRKASFEGPLSTPRVPKGRTMGGERDKDTGPIKEIRAARVAPSSSGPGQVGNAVLLPVPVVQSHLRAKVEQTDVSDYVEGINRESQSHSEINYRSEGKIQWLDFLPSAVLDLVVTEHFVAVASEDATLNVYSPAGRRLMPTLKLDAVASHLHASKWALMALTATGQLSVWNVQHRESKLASVSICPLLSAAPSSSSSPAVSVVSAQVRPNGTPVIQLSTPSAYAYDAALASWVQLCDVWWADGSPLNSRGRSAVASTRGPVASIEHVVSDGRPEDGQARPEWWDTALTLGHLDLRMAAAVLLDSPTEYKQYLLAYAKKLGEEGFRARAEELIKDLLGPIYYHPARPQRSWTPSVLGHQKRDLLREVLAVFVRSNTLVALGQSYQDVLKKATADDGY